VILAIDCGNTRIKWGLYAGVPGRSGAWRSQGSVPLGDFARLDADWSALPEPQSIVISNVAGSAVGDEVGRRLQRFSATPIRARARGTQCGVTNTYADPTQLGADRWAALIAARHLHGGASVVVSAGTATTVDLLSAAGIFRGGVILPGVELMKESLSERTAGLPLSRGDFAEEPRSTADAIETGCLLAQAGAIERIYARAEAGALCLISGGAALRIAARLSVPVRVIEHLVLEGLVRMAAG
jgi:type III pantothenate kinase